MKVIIAGGTGLIGRELIPALVQSGHTVWVLTRRPGQSAVPSGAQAVGWDARTPAGWEAQAAQADAIINLAGANIGERPWTNARKALIRDSSKQTGQAITQAVAASPRKPAVVIQVSGVNYYKDQGDALLTESAPAGDDFLASVALDWEAATRGVAEMGVRHVVMRTGVVLAPTGGVLDPFLLQHRLFAGGPLGSGRQWISWIHIHDLVRSFQFFLERADAQEAFNVTAPEPVTNADFGRTLGRLLRRPYWLPAPAFALKIVLGEMSKLVLDGVRVYPQRLLQMGFSFEFDTLQKALEDLVKQRSA